MARLEYYSTKNCHIVEPNFVSPRKNAPKISPKWTSTWMLSSHSSQRISGMSTKLFRHGIHTFQQPLENSKKFYLTDFRVNTWYFHGCIHNKKDAQFIKIRKNLQATHAPETPISPLVTGQLGRLNQPNGTLHKFIAKEIAMNTADDDPSLIRQKILRHAYKVRISLPYTTHNLGHKR